MNVIRVIIAAWAIIAVLWLGSAEAIPAFPGAEGGGAASVGGRGGRVILVTNLKDSGDGSLRKCVQESGARTCVFRIGGTINLSSQIEIHNPQLTIAGQTAPGGGIQLRGSGTNQSLMRNFTNNVVVQYLRLRHGRSAGCANECGGNFIWTKGTRHLILDHISAHFNQDDGIAGIVGRDITVGWSIVGEGIGATQEPLRATGIAFGGPTAADSAAAVNFDIHHTLTTNVSHRNPLLRIKSSRFVNNIVYNAKAYFSHFSGGMTTDVISNIYKRGPLGPSAARREVGVLASGSNAKQAPGPPSLYMLGNVGERLPNPSGDQFLLATELGGENGPDTGPVRSSWRRPAPMANTVHPITATAVGGLEAAMLPIVGASRRLGCDGKWIINRDSQDKKVVRQYETNTGATTLPGHEDGFGGFPTIASGPACVDEDNDGMPNAYEVIKGFPVSIASNNVDSDGDGFTNLEEFLSGEDGGVQPPEDPPDPGADKFKAGDRVFVKPSSLTVRNAPAGTVLGSQSMNAQGAVLSGPTATAGGAVWYEINYDTGLDGWSSQSGLEKVLNSDIPPTVSITSPAEGATVSGTSVSVTASASDNVGVVGVQFKLDGANLGVEDTTSPYSVTWDTTTSPNGTHALTAVARDASGLTTTSATRSVTVNNVAASGFTIGENSVLATTDTPSANVVRAGAAVLGQRGTIQTMTIWANTAGGNVRMGIYDDDGAGGIPGTLKAETAGASPGVVGWHTQPVATATLLEPGTYWLAFVTDGALQTKGQSTGGDNKRDGNTYGPFPNPFALDTSSTWLFSLFATFTPNADTIAPTVSLTAPSPGNVSGSSVSVTATASDAVGVAGVQFVLDNTVNIGAEDTTSPYSVIWDTTPVVNGPHTLTGVARDAAGNKAISAGVAVTVVNALAAPSGLSVVRVAP